MSNLKNFLFTSESVSEGHPDKVSDRISDMVVDSYLSGDPFSRVACETLTTTNKVVLAGEVRGPSIKEEDLIQKVRECIKDIGYDQDGFTWRGELALFRADEIECKEFNLPGSAIIFPSFINHKVNKIISGRRNTLAIWMSGPKFR